MPGLLCFLQIIQGFFNLLQQFPYLQVLGALLFAVAAVDAVLGSSAGLLLVVDIVEIGLLGQIMETVDIVVSIGLEDLGDLDALGAGLAVAAAGAVELGELLEVLEALAHFAPLLLGHGVFQRGDGGVLFHHLNALHAAQGAAHAGIAQHEPQGQLVGIQAAGTQLFPGR